MLLLLVACTRSPATFTAAQVDAAGNAAAAVDADVLMAHVNALVDTHATEEPFIPPEPRYEGRPFTHLGSRDYVAETLAGMGLEPQVADAGQAGRESYSVWADIPGTARPDEIVLVSAHHDAWFVGADDNSTGVAVILEVARAMAAAPGGRTVRVMAWDREEEGDVGSAAWVESEGVGGLYRVLNLDSVGYTDSAPGSQKSLLGLDAPDTADFLAVIAAQPSADDVEATMALAPTLPRAPRLAGVLGAGDVHSALLFDLLRSDHAPFWAQGVPGLFFTDTTEFRNPRYHTAEDTPDTLDPVFLGDVGALTAGVVAAWAVVE